METATYDIHQDLIEKCKAGNSYAEYELYRLYSKAMLNTAYRICGSKEEAEDVLQESFLSAFRNINTYRQESTFGAWLKRIVINKSLSSIRKSKHETIMIEEVTDEPLQEHESEVQLSFDENALSVKKIKEAMLKLPIGFRTVLSLYLMEGYDHKEIGDILNISESTSKTQYKRAKDKLKIILEKEVNYG